jgi:hypothetical protein
VQSIEPLRIDPVYVAHATRQIGIRSLNQQMIVIFHLAIGGNFQIPKLNRFHQKLKEYLVVSILQKNPLAPPTTVHHMVPGIWILDP